MRSSKACGTAPRPHRPSLMPSHHKAGVRSCAGIAADTPLEHDRKSDGARRGGLCIGGGVHQALLRQRNAVTGQKPLRLHFVERGLAL